MVYLRLLLPLLQTEPKAENDGEFDCENDLSVFNKEYPPVILLTFVVLTQTGYIESLQTSKLN